MLWLAEGELWRGFALIAAGLGGLVALLLTSKHGLDITFHNGVLRGLSDFSVGVGMAVLFRAPEAARPAAGLGAFADPARCCWACWCYGDR